MKGCEDVGSWQPAASGTRSRHRHDHTTGHRDGHGADLAPSDSRARSRQLRESCGFCHRGGNARGHYRFAAGRYQLRSLRGS